LAASVVAVSVGGAVYWKYQERLKEEARMEQAIAAARAALLSQKKNVPAEIARPWAVMASPRATTRACIQNFTHLTPGGWKLDEYACTPSEVTYAWSRQYSTVSYLLAQVPGANVDLNG